MAFYSIVLSAIFVTIHAAPPDSSRITAVANVTLRAAPSPEAPAVAQLALGTEVTEAGPAGLDKTWVRVRLADSREGWVQANLTRPLDPVWRWPTFDGIIASRLGRKGDGFPARVELVAFIERVAGEYTDPDGRARIDLSRLRALSSAQDAIPFGHGQREPYAAWLAPRRGEVIYDEPGGHFMIADTSIWNLQARHAASPVADDIAWFAVNNGLAGECEGGVACYLAWRNRLHGEYLRRHPAGRHAADAVDVVKSTAEALVAPPAPHAAYEFDKKRDCREVVASVDALVGAVQGTRVAGRDAALEALATLRKRCQ